MKSRLQCLFISLSIGLAGKLHAEESWTLQASGSVQLHVIAFDSEENVGFEIIDTSQQSHRAYLSQHYQPEHDLLIINGGYFDGNLNPVGFCKIEGRVLSERKKPELSGYLALSESGQISLHWKDILTENYRAVIQCGPYVIDPGGKIGIRAPAGTPSKRTVVAQTLDDKILVITTSEVDLYALAKILRTELPDIERALNLDGGPSCGLIYGKIHRNNLNPISNFIRKRK